MQMRGVRGILTFVVIVVMTLVIGSTALGQEGVSNSPIVQIPSIYYGTVVDESGNAIPEGIVKAYVDNEFCGELAFSDGQYGIPATDPNVRRLLVYSLSNDLTGKKVDFRIRSGAVEYIALTKPEKVVWESRKKMQVDLVMTGTAAPYNDMLGHWAGDTVELLAGDEIISGYDDYTFRPENPVSRAECAVMLMRALGVEDAASIPFGGFADQDEIPQWAGKWVAAAASAGLIKGYPGGDGAILFRPGGAVTRAELAAIAGRIDLKEESNEKSIVFSDQDKLPGWAIKDIEQAVNKGLVNGYPDGSFRPENQVTRAEAAAIVARLLEKIENDPAQ